MSCQRVRDLASILSVSREAIMNDDLNILQDASGIFHASFSTSGLIDAIDSATQRVLEDSFHNLPSEFGSLTQTVNLDKFRVNLDDTNN